MHNRFPDNVTGIIISRCLLGESCRYDGRDENYPAVIAFIGDRPIYPVCPEVEAGLGIPRPPIHIVGKDGASVWDHQGTIVERDTGRDVTEPLIAAAHRLMAPLEDLPRLETLCLFKERSPSCGVHRTHTQAGLTEGPGFWTALCIRAGFTVFSEEDMEVLP